MEQPQMPTMPKKSCIITVMFPMTDNKLAMDIKGRIDDIVKDIPEKRYTFQVNET